MRNPVIPVSMLPQSMDITPGFVGGKLSDIPLRDIPHQNQVGKSRCFGIQLLCVATIATRANDLKVLSYLFHQLFDWSVEGPEGLKFTDRLGYHDTHRQVQKFGRFRGAVPLDIEATGGSPGTATRTFSKWLWFEERMSPDPLARVVPMCVLAKCRLRIKALKSTAAIVSYGSGINLLALDVTPIFHVQDVPENQLRIPQLIEEGSKQNDSDPRPTPGPGHYMRCMAVNPPTLDTFADDLSSIAMIDFGTKGKLTQQERDTSELVQTYTSEQSSDPHRISNTVDARQKAEFRFYDPIENVDQKMRGLPLVWTGRGDGIASMPAWGTNPQLKMNNNVQDGLPPSLDFIYDRYVERTPAQTKFMMDVIRDATDGRVSRAFELPGYKGYPQQAKCPLGVG